MRCGIFCTTCNTEIENPFDFFLITPSTLCALGVELSDRQGRSTAKCELSHNRNVRFGGNQDENKIFVPIGLLYDGSFRVLYCNNRDKSSAIKYDDPKKLGCRLDFWFGAAKNGRDRGQMSTWRSKGYDATLLCKWTRCTANFGDLCANDDSSYLR